LFHSTLFLTPVLSGRLPPPSYPCVRLSPPSLRRSLSLSLLTLQKDITSTLPKVAKSLVSLSPSCLSDPTSNAVVPPFPPPFIERVQTYSSDAGLRLYVSPPYLSRFSPLFSDGWAVSSGTLGWFLKPVRPPALIRLNDIGNEGSFSDKYCPLQSLFFASNSFTCCSHPILSLSSPRQFLPPQAFLVPKVPLTLIFWFSLTTDIGALLFFRNSVPLGTTVNLFCVIPISFQRYLPPPKNFLHPPLSNPQTETILFSTAEGKHFLKNT